MPSVRKNLFLEVNLQHVRTSREKGEFFMLGPLSLSPSVSLSLCDDKLWYEKRKQNKWPIESSLVLYPLILCLHHTKQQLIKRQETFSVLSCVSVHTCVSVSVNTTLIALALQLADFKSKENFGVNNGHISKVLKGVIILCIPTEKNGGGNQKKTGRRGD